MAWESAERVQKNDAGEFRALIGGEWVPVQRAQRSDSGEFRVERGAPAAPAAEAAAAPPSFADQLAAAARDPLGELAAGGRQLLQHGINLQSGAIRGAGSIGATIMRPFETAEENAQRRADITGGLELMGAQPNTLAFQTGKLGGEIAGTAGVGNAIAMPLRVARAAPAFATALESGGTAAKLPLWMRGVGGAVTGGAGGAVIDPTAQNIGTSMAFGGLVPMGLQAWKAARNYLSPDMLAQSNTLRSITGDTAAETAANQQAVLAANRAAKPGESAAQAAAALPKDMPGYQAILSTVEESQPMRADLAAKETQTRPILDRLSRVAGGATATEAKATAAGTKASVSGVTAPLREDSLAAVQRRAEIVQEAKKTGRQLLMAPEYPGANLETPKPLDVSDLIGKVEGMADSPAVRVDSVQSGVLKRVADLIRTEVERGDGVMDVRALYGIRKSAINTEVQRLMPNADAKAQKKYAAQLLSTLKPSIDKAITEAGGAGWSSYLKTFESGMNTANQQAMAAKLLSTYKSSPDTFLKIMAGEDPKAVEKIFGPGSFDLAEEMGAKLSPARDLEAHLLRERKIAGNVLTGAPSAQSILNSTELGFRIPNLLSPKIALINSAIKELEGKVNKKTYETLLKASRSGASMNDLIQMTPPSERLYIVDTLNKASRYATPAVSNAMAGQ